MPDSRRVLVVDDNPDEAEALLMLLDKAGYDVRIAFDGPSALELAGTFTPDVAMLDINMLGWTATKSPASCDGASARPGPPSLP